MFRSSHGPDLIPSGQWLPQGTGLGKGTLCTPVVMWEAGGFPTLLHEIHAKVAAQKVLGGFHI